MYNNPAFYYLNYPTLYHQMEDLIMIYLVPESEVKKTYEIFYEKNALADYRTEKYLNRIVTSANQLVEKIQIFDAGKDDRVTVEMYGLPWNKALPLPHNGQISCVLL